MRALFALFVRALREDTRSRLPPLLRSILILVILIVLWANERDFSNRTAHGREFLGLVLMANIGLIAIATLGIFSSAITEEKEDQTLTLLRMTGLSPLAILFGKSTSRLMAALLLLAVQIPFTLLAVTLGGVSREQVLSAYAVLGATTFLLCNLALLCSVICRTTLRAGISAGVVCGLSFVLLPIICITSSLHTMPLGALTPSTPWEHFGTWLVESNPAYTLVVLIKEPTKTAPVANHVSVNLAGGLLCFLACWLLFDRFCTNSAENVTPARKRKVVSRGIWQIRSRPTVKYPLTWKDFYFLSGGFRGLFARFATCGLIFLGAYAYERWLADHGRNEPTQTPWQDIGDIIMDCAVGMLVIEAILFASRIFGHERRELTLGSLVTLPRTNGWLIRQKLLTCLPVIAPSLILYSIGLRLTLIGQGISYNWAMFWMRDDGVPFYALMQLLLVTALVSYLSLRIRCGALPTAIAIMIAINILTAVASDVFQIGETITLATSANMCGIAVIVFFVLFCSAIPRVGAAE